MKKRKLKKSAKAFFIIIVLGIIILSLVICKFLLINKYEKNYANIKRIYDKGEILNKINLTRVHATKFISLNENNKISIDYQNFERDGDNKFKIVGYNGENYTFKFNITKSKDEHQQYFDMVGDIETVVKNKITIFTPLIVSGSKATKANRINKLLPEYDQIVIIDGNYVDGYSYKKDNTYTFILFNKKEKIELSFEGNDLSYDYLATIISSLQAN